MNRLYLTIPVILVVIFGGIYWQHSRTTAAHAAEKAAAVTVAQQIEAGKKAEAERLARADADKRAAERLAEEQKKAAEKKARYEEDGRLLVADTARYTAKVTALTAELAAQEKHLVELRARRAALNTETFTLAKDVELARIAKRNAELEIQRLTEMVARQAAGATLAQ